jgi:hypothetical protein
MSFDLLCRCGGETLGLVYVLTSPVACVLAVQAVGPQRWNLCCLTFELSGRQRQDARPGPVKMYSVPPARAWWPAVGAPLERGVRPRREWATLDQRHVYGGEIL